MTSLLSTEFSDLISTEINNQDVAYFIAYLKKNSMPAQKIVITRGHKSRSLSSLFDEWAAALQFPVYFGENLSAFVDCLRDFPRSNFTSLTIVVTNSSELLKDDKECLSDFYHILANLSKEWQQMYPKQQSVLFRLILQDVKERMQITEAALNDLKITHTKITGDWLSLLSE